nr:MAG TPA: hypothetical protein [Caudoviricetes sp.]DAI94568.1 MAG TPA: hypothetical protein [Caudoviricetes sp.]DAJ33609.1 MAG TPA: hypothetical protein [Bacteriophage sp.]
MRATLLVTYWLFSDKRRKEGEKYCKTVQRLLNWTQRTD